MSLSGERSDIREENEVERYVSENLDLLTRILAQGDDEARGYALALLANGGTLEDIERVQRQLREIKKEMKDG